MIEQCMCQDARRAVVTKQWVITKFWLVIKMTMQCSLCALRVKPPAVFVWGHICPFTIITQRLEWVVK